MIFSIFGKKKKKQTAATTATSTLQPTTDTDPQSIMAQRHAARATERKIDAIEFEMTREIMRTSIVQKKNDPDATPQQLNANVNLLDDARIFHRRDTDDFATTIPLTDALSDSLSDFLLHADTPIENTPAMEEAALLFANDQLAETERVLQHAIQDETTLNANAWFMLFDFYQITNNQPQFDQLSLDYVNKHEISAPTWKAPTTEPVPDNTVEPVETFRDLTANTLSECEQLLQRLQALKKIPITIIGASDLITQVRSLIEVGRRDENDAAWLLWLELLRLTNDEQGFEEASMDYCITYEISPPPFEAPVQIQHKATPIQPTIAIAEDRLVLPAVIAGDINPLLNSITAFAQTYQAIRFDCSRLNRVSLTASGQLLIALISLAKQLPAPIEFYEVNYLVAALLHCTGFDNIAHVSLRKLQ